MKKGNLLLCKSNNKYVNKIFGWLIKFFTGSDYVHIVMVSDDYNTIIEATGQEVQCTQNYWVNYDTYKVKCDQYQIDMAINYARKQLGKWYDWGALFYLCWLTITFQRSKINEWNDKNRWFCSELVCASFREAGIVLCPDLANANTSPQDIADSKLVEKC